MCLLLAAASIRAAAQDAPRFSDYPATGEHTGRLAPLDLRSEPKAAMLQTRHREARKGGANFAGHYALTRWGCGTDCFLIGIVDIRTGDAYGDEPPEWVRTRYVVWDGEKLRTLESGEVGPEATDGA